MIEYLPLSWALGLVPRLQEDRQTGKQAGRKHEGKLREGRKTGRLRQEDHGFEASLIYTLSLKPDGLHSKIMFVKHETTGLGDNNRTRRQPTGVSQQRHSLQQGRDRS